LSNFPLLLADAFFLGDAEPPFSASDSVSLSPVFVAAFFRPAVMCLDFLGAPPLV
jgi:hypothetical protein